MPISLNVSGLCVECVCVLSVYVARVKVFTRRL